ncbi:hypothetical protein ACEPAF_1132 [Sanghuangporus sanghuang]
MWGCVRYRRSPGLAGALWPLAGLIVPPPGVKAHLSFSQKKVDRNRQPFASCLIIPPNSIRIRRERRDPQDAPLTRDDSEEESCSYSADSPTGSSDVDMPDQMDADDSSDAESTTSSSSSSSSLFSKSSGEAAMSNRGG